MTAWAMDNTKGLMFDGKCICSTCSDDERVADVKTMCRPARTIAALAGTADIGAGHVSEAIQYRSLNRGKGLA